MESCHVMPLWHFGFSSLVEVERPIILPLIETRCDGQTQCNGPSCQKCLSVYRLVMSHERILCTDSTCHRGPWVLLMGRQKTETR